MSNIVEKLPDELPEDQRQLIVSKYRELLRSFKVPLSKEDAQMIREAFEWAAEAHKKQYRKTGEPYITHPIEVARICVEEIGLGATAVVCALLHDIVEDTEATLEEVRRRFPDAGGELDKNGLPKSKIADIVDGLTKLDSLHEKESPQAENIRHVLEAMIKDVRVVMIKMADRIHNLRTIDGHKNIEKALKIAAETESVYAPLAHRLGLYKIKTEFQDICLKITDREEYDNIANKLAETKVAREAYISNFVKPVAQILKDYEINAEVFGRPKSIYSIWNKMRSKKVNFEGIFDLFAIRVIIDPKLPEILVKEDPKEQAEAKEARLKKIKIQEHMACWNAYALITDCYMPIPERQKDWMSTSKINGYESLHITVLGPDARYIEVQIRTKRMDAVAERGMAAHWKYKRIAKTATGFDMYGDWLENIRESLERKDDPLEVLAEVLRGSFVENAVHVMTPKGDRIVLPEKATGLDFAFAVHSDIGCKCHSIKVNGALQPFNYQLQNGDQVTIITRESQKPTEDWLHYVITSKARNRIKAALNDDKRKLAADGKEILARKLSNTYKINVEENIEFLAKYYNYPSRLEFLSAVALDQVDFKLLKNLKIEGSLFVMNVVPSPVTDVGSTPAEASQGNRESLQQIGNDVIINNEPGTYYSYHLASCCNPVQGDPIFAYVTVREGTKIHRNNCPNAKNLRENLSRILEASWGNVARREFVTQLVITGSDRGRGVIEELSKCISDLGINIRSFSIQGDNGYFEGHFSVLVRNAVELNFLIKELRKFEYVQNVRREEGSV